MGEGGVGGQRRHRGLSRRVRNPGCEKVGVYVFASPH